MSFPNCVTPSQIGKCMFLCEIVGTDVFDDIMYRLFPRCRRLTVATTKRRRPDTSELVELVMWSRVQQVSREWRERARHILSLSLLQNYIIREMFTKSSGSSVESLVRDAAYELPGASDGRSATRLYILRTVIERGATIPILRVTNGCKGLAGALRYILSQKEKKLKRVYKSVGKMCQSAGHEDALAVLAEDPRIDLSLAYFGLPEYRQQMRQLFPSPSPQQLSILLQRACEINDEKFVEELLSEGARPSEKALAHAVRLADPSIFVTMMRKLGEHDVHLIDAAVAQNEHWVLNLVFSAHGVQIPEYYMRYIAEDLERWPTNYVKMILEYPGVALHIHDQYLLKWFTSTSRTDIVELLLHLGGDPSVDGNRCLINAGASGVTDMVNLLLRDERVNPGDTNNATIRRAAMDGNYNVVECLLKDERVDPSDCDNSAITVATEMNHVEMVRLLLTDERVVRAGLEKAYWRTTRDTPVGQLLLAAGAPDTRPTKKVPKEWQMKDCGHDHCELTSAHLCCACGDERNAAREGYGIYVDGVGWTTTQNRKVHYCPGCKE
ncbi:putative ankyrin repeat protein [Planoprotostelium fungivorum]|uniref:Putative ankyrin repeat protein n=1 Tax=Planoprotostelium fungivorum TaxID=1890364 RepID=A0A2P6NMU8_9EUKA|nr:putative ankyrin repeat protein [Planoprotostelium fungivorum]